MTEWVNNGLIVGVALAFLAVESLVLLAWRGSGLSPAAVLVNAGAGGSLMLALGAALLDLGAAWVAGALLLALGFHGADLAVRIRTAKAA